MPTNEFSRASEDAANVFEVFANGRIGELITEVVGNDELQKRFEEHPEFQQKEFDGKPSGIIALELGIVNKEVKNALLVAQAACRAVAVAQGNQEAKPLTDDVFKFVGSDRDPEILKEAQATWQIANYVHHDEMSRDVFAKQAAKYLHHSAQVLEGEGFSDAASKISAVYDSVRFVRETPYTPNDYVKDAYLAQSEANTGAGPDVVYEEILKKLDNLTSGQGVEDRALANREQIGRAHV